MNRQHKLNDSYVSRKMSHHYRRGVIKRAEKPNVYVLSFGSMKMAGD